MKITISNDARGTITVHKATCRDLAREKFEARWTIDAKSMRDVVYSVYPPGDFEYDAGLEWRSYNDDLVYKPCTRWLLAD